MEDNRVTREVVHLIDTEVDTPNPGEKVFALSLGGKLVEMVWNKDSRKHYHAWMPYPKVPKTVKEKLNALYNSGKSWGNHGTQVHSSGQSQ